MVKDAETSGKRRRTPGAVLINPNSKQLPVNRYGSEQYQTIQKRRMEQKLEEYLKKSKGKFSLYKITWTIGDIRMAMFRRFLKKCVRKGTLLECKDRYGIVWYSRPD
jgi:ribosomal protein S9